MTLITRRAMCIFAILAHLTACGGGGGNDSATDQKQDNETSSKNPLVGDWEVFYTQSKTFKGNTGGKLFYYMFLDDETMVGAACAPAPASLAEDCQSDNYECKKTPYTFDGRDVNPVLEGDFNPFSVVFEEDGSVFVGTGTYLGEALVNKYRKAAVVPEGALKCR